VDIPSGKNEARQAEAEPGRPQVRILAGGFIVIKAKVSFNDSNSFKSK